MKFFADFHIHSKYSRATSRDMDLPTLDEWAKTKGIKVLGTGDFTHPAWFESLRENLVEKEPGLFLLKGSENETRFIFTSEISCIYQKGGKTRKVHVLLFAPSFEAVEDINRHLGVLGNLKADGRPILGLDAKELAKIALNASADCLVVPAHMWTPWFSVFGSRSGFDSLDECFEDYSKYIYAGETGLSSDPAMNWRLSSLDKIALISNSDAHSPRKIGREVNAFDTDLSFYKIMEAIKEKDSNKFLYTVEFFPEEGKYHFDGHRFCQTSFSPKETKKYNGLCPACGKPLTIGVLNRVDDLADRPEGFVPQGAIPFKNLIPLEEIIADALGAGVLSKQVREKYERLVKVFGSEFEVLLEAPKEDFEKEFSPEIAEGIIRVREGKVSIQPGYDGEYGKIKIFSEVDKNSPISQKTLF